MQAKMKRLEDKDPVASALATVVTSLPPSKTPPIPGFEEIPKWTMLRSKPGEERQGKENGNMQLWGQ